MTREEALTLALDAAGRAKTLAGHAESAAYGDQRGKAEALAAASAALADVARTYLAATAALPEMETTRG
ncbi:hypothetical protein [Streptomyces glaucus]|uniref:SAV-6107-like HEPN domain-containing protein n=1 Tax=Streptomyces glaucus TaxID=284029 RepID=A0ABN3JYY6_9ACTN